MVFLTLEDVLELHRRVIAEFGGAHGVRDQGILESAIVAAENRYYYENADAIGCASTLGWHLVKAHAFIDGNKRVGLAALRTFLIVNGASFAASEDARYQSILAIARGELDAGSFEEWLRERTVIESG